MTGPHSFKLLYVQWEDALSGGANWKTRTEIEELKPAKMVSIGWLVAAGETYITLVSHMCQPDDQFGGEICIPRAWITSEKEIILD